MNNITYVQAVPRIRAVENKLLDKAKIQRLLDSTSASEAFKVLKETSYGLIMGEIKRPEDYEIVLNKELKKLYFFMYEISPQKDLIDIMCIKYDYHNIKVLLKSKILQKDFKEILMPIGTINVNNLTNWILNEEYKELPELMKESIKKSMYEFKEDNDPQKIDTIIDKYLYMDMLMRAKRLDNCYILKFLKINIDLANIRTLVRVKKQNKSRKFLENVLIDGGSIQLEELLDIYNLNIESISSKIQYTDYVDVIRVGIEEYIKTENLKVFERLCDNFIMNFIKDAKYISFGPEPLISYILAKENEIKIIRIIMVGKLNNIDPQVIKERLREIYV
ncbi:V-type ATP synthase subunit C [Clostridium botulinum]|uniref:V-type ATP synthase subunit C n=1 Tax=Clostridium botulinum TaxID=1491 RepID=UPI0004D6C26C|nr:V-type ATP synthase subunit C [Clostridium botulinum]KEH99620.1 ATP synthase subunit C [Clostridium botulinum D str. 16868]KLU74774.1 ATP synthase subunit C [Clostridium botulinum V891]KOA78416.1 ATP synthase subunit C [Clostridium botulinum]KOA93763.1 ATP synthase subunit C [Clostridium botulinum]KOC33719.1 ATP synthase subunit C [Clostridium botulinum]